MEKTSVLTSSFVSFFVRPIRFHHSTCNPFSGTSIWVCSHRFTSISVNKCFSRDAYLYWLCPSEITGVIGENIRAYHFSRTGVGSSTRLSSHRVRTGLYVMATCFFYPVSHHFRTLLYEDKKITSNHHRPFSHGSSASLADVHEFIKLISNGRKNESYY